MLQYFKQKQRYSAMEQRPFEKRESLKSQMSRGNNKSSVKGGELKSIIIYMIVLMFVSIFSSSCYKGENNNYEEPKVEPTGISIYPTNITFRRNDFKELEAEIMPYNAIYTTIDWESLNSEIVEVIGWGNSASIYAKSVGETEVVASIKNGLYKAQCKVIVKPAAYDDPDGTITISVRNYNNGNTGVKPDGCEWSFGIDGGDNFYGYNNYYQFATIGKVEGLGDVINIPASGYAPKVSVTPGYGYVAKYSYSGKTIYVRIYVIRYILAASNNGVIGAEIKYQSPFVP